MRKALVVVILCITLTAGFYLGTLYQNNNAQSLRVVSQNQPPELFNYTLSDKSQFARGIVTQVSNNVLFLRTSDEIIPMVVSAETVISTASYPLSLNKEILIGNFNNIHAGDKIDVRFKNINGRNFTAGLLIWNNLRKQK